jgi:hypothetical protein
VSNRLYPPLLICVTPDISVLIYLQKQRIKMDVVQERGRMCDWTKWRIYSIKESEKLFPPSSIEVIQLTREV